MIKFSRRRITHQPHDTAHFATASACHAQRQYPTAAWDIDRARPRSAESETGRTHTDAAGLAYQELLFVGGFGTFVEAFDDAAELHGRYVRRSRTWCAGEGERVL